jgi:hypothetical protein
MQHALPKWPENQLDLAGVRHGFAIYFSAGTGQFRQYFAGRVTDPHDTKLVEQTLFVHQEAARRTSIFSGILARIETVSDADQTVSSIVARLERLQTVVPDAAYLEGHLYDGESWRVIVNRDGAVVDFGVVPDRRLELKHPAIQEVQSILNDARQSLSTLPDQTPTRKRRWWR